MMHGIFLVSMMMSHSKYMISGNKKRRNNLAKWTPIKTIAHQEEDIIHHKEGGEMKTTKY